MEDIDSLEMILNSCLSKAMCRKGRIQHPNSNNIAEFVSNFLKEENLSGSQKVRNSTDPALNLHGVMVSVCSCKRSGVIDYGDHKECDECGGEVQTEP